MYLVSRKVQKLNFRNPQYKEETKKSLVLKKKKKLNLLDVVLLVHSVKVVTQF